jgi:hypothetical protein
MPVAWAAVGLTVLTPFGKESIMASNYTQATVSPVLPASLFSEEELDALAVACGLSCQRVNDDLYFFAEEFFREGGEDDDGEELNGLALFQAKLHLLDAVAYPHITIHGSSTCSKMRADEFGGFAHVITREYIRSISTWQWIARQTGQWVLTPESPDGGCDAVGPPQTITIEVRGGVVQEVSNVPPGLDYRIIDHDDLDDADR